MDKSLAAASSRPGSAPEAKPKDTSSNNARFGRIKGSESYQYTGKGRQETVFSYPSGGVNNGGTFGSKRGNGNGRQRKNKSKPGTGTPYKTEDQVGDLETVSTELDLSSCIPAHLEKGHKRNNITHWLNVQLTPRESANPAYRRGMPGSAGKKGTRHFSHRTPYSKDHFLQANCQFIVRAGSDYSVYMVDPDLLVEWTWIEQIRLQSVDIPSCPICLHPPVAGRMTRCGHVYCWACMLHYLALSDKAWRACPICDHMVYPKDLKSVVSVAYRSYKVGDTVEMRLMKRDRHSLLPVLAGGNAPISSSLSQPLSVIAAMDSGLQCKLMTAMPADIRRVILQKEKVELLTQLEAEKDCPESIFILQALELLEKRAESNGCYEGPGNTDLNPELFQDSLVGGAQGGEEGTNLGDALGKELGDLTLEDVMQDGVLMDRSRYTSTSSEGLSSLPDEGVKAEDLDFSAVLSPVQGQEPCKGKDVFYFYQAGDGQHMFLHSVNVQMLVKQYGSLERCPPVIVGRIVEKESTSMTEELRQRLRYLSHLPLTTVFDVVELALDEPVINPEVAVLFKDRLAERQRHRQRRQRDEKRRDRLIQQAEDAKWGRFPKPNIRMDSQYHFPQPEFVASPSPRSEDSFLAESSLMSVPVSVQQSPQSGPSFAQMLRDGEMKTSATWPTISSNPISAAAACAWGPGVGPATKVRKDSETEPEHECYVPVPNFRETFGSALAQAFDDAAIKSVLDQGKDAKDSGDGKKKKKTKPKVLFATGMNFK